MGTPRSLDLPTLGPRVTQLASACGKTLMPWQQHVLNVGMEVRNARWRYRFVVVHVQRRAGKTVMVFYRQAHRAWSRPKSGVWYGAQSRKDGLEIWDQRINDLLGQHAKALGFKQRKSVGSERMEYKNLSRVALFTPADSSLVGLDTDLVDVDEARFHSVSMGLSLESGIRPTQATRDGQLWLESSAGTYGVSDWLHGWIKKGRAAIDDPESDTAFFDYCIPDDADPTDLDVVCDYHPAVGDPAEGFTIPRDFIASERDSMDPNDFAREYAGRWTSSVEQVIAPHDWSACADPTTPQPTPGDLAMAFATTPDRTMSAINVAWRDLDGVPRTAVMDQRPGADWVQDRFLELVARWNPSVTAYNAVGPALSIADSLTRGGLELTPCNFTDYVVACGSFYEMVKARTLRHNAQPDLDDAVAAVARRTLGDRWVWGHKASAAPIVALEGSTVASWAYDHRPPPRAPSAVITLDPQT